LLAEAKRAGALTIEFDRELTPLSPEFAACIYGPLVETVPEWVKRAMADK
jgi:NAD-dependent SIR2 family protein deacetylase